MFVTYVMTLVFSF